MNTEINDAAEGENESSGDDDYRAEILEAQGLVGSADDPEELSEEAEGEAVSEAEGTAESAESEESAPDDKPEGEGESEQEPDKSTEEPAAPPKGFVKLQALHSEREHRQHVQGVNEDLTARVSELEGQLETTRLQALAAAQSGGFKELSPEELKQLAYDDPEGVPKYLENKAKYDSAVSELSAGVKNESYITKEFKADANYAFSVMEAEFPGVFEVDSETQKSFYSNFAAAKLPDSVYSLLNPETAIIPVGSDKPIPLGEMAVSVMKLINSAGKQSETHDIEKIRKDITAEVTKDLMAKFKKPDQSTGSLADINSVDRDGPEAPEPTEAQISKFSEDQYDRYCAGLDWRKK